MPSLVIFAMIFTALGLNAQTKPALEVFNRHQKSIWILALSSQGDPLSQVEIKKDHKKVLVSPQLSPKDDIFLAIAFDSRKREELKDYAVIYKLKSSGESKAVTFSPARNKALAEWLTPETGVQNNIKDSEIVIGRIK